MFNKPEAVLLNKSSCLAAALGVTKYLNMRDQNLFTLLWYSSQTLMFNKPTSCFQ
jgi:hypothetical protein